MAKLVKCDSCGAVDDYTAGDVPFLPEGAVIGLRDETMDIEPALTLEICISCRDKLLKAFPKLKKKFEDMTST